MTYYLHELPGRLRVKIPIIKRNVRETERLKLLVESIRGVGSATTNIITGSIVITFDENTITSREILNRMAQEGFIDITKALSSQEYVTDVIASAGRQASKALLGMALERSLQGTSLSILAVLI